MSECPCGSFHSLLLPARPLVVPPFLRRRPNDRVTDGHIAGPSQCPNGREAREPCSAECPIALSGWRNGGASRGSERFAGRLPFAAFSMSDRPASIAPLLHPGRLVARRPWQACAKYR